MFRNKGSLCLFLLPGLSFLLIFYVIPLFGGVLYSITDGTRDMAFVGMQNYVSMWHNKMFQLGLRNTLELSLINAPLLWILSFLLAWMLFSIQPHGAFFQTVVLLPYLSPSSALLLIWQVIFDFGGPINRFMRNLGLERVMWLESEALRIPIIMLFLWKNLGFCTVVFLSALQSVPLALYEYASLEGAGFFTKAFKVALPQIIPTAFFASVTSWINALKIFKEVYVIAGAYPNISVYTLQHYINNMFAKLDYQMVTSAAYSFAIIVLLVFGLLYVIQHRAVCTM